MTAPQARAEDAGSPASEPENVSRASSKPRRRNSRRGLPCPCGTGFGEDGVRYSVALIPLIFGLPAMLLAPLILRLYSGALGKLTREN